MANRIIENHWIVKNFGLSVSIIGLLILTPLAESKVPEFQTTRLKSTGGAGVGSVLMDEATMLNPAPIAFFNESSLYFQKSDGKIKNEETNPFREKKSDIKAFILSDGKSGVKGSVSYFKQDLDNEYRNTIGLSLASPAGKSSALGFSYRFIEQGTEESDYSPSVSKKKYQPGSVGVLHAINENFTLGLVVIDPLKKGTGDNKAIIGVQYLYASFFSLLFDAGADYGQTISERNLYRAAVQIKVLDDFFLKAGTFNDRIIKEKGTGIGVSWISPKLYVDFAMKNSTFLEDVPLKQKGKRVKESSFSVALHF